MSESSDMSDEAPPVLEKNSPVKDERGGKIEDEYPIEKPKPRRRIILRIMRKRKADEPEVQEAIENKKPKTEEKKVDPNSLERTLVCPICGIRKPLHLLRSFFIRIEKALVLLSGIFTRKLTMNDALQLFRLLPHHRICRQHFSDAAAILMKIMKCHTPFGVYLTNVRYISLIKVHMQKICGERMRLERVKQTLFCFVDRYQNPKPLKIVPMKQLYPPISTAILPKSHRQPRKQVFDVEKPSEHVVKIIETEQFHVASDNLTMPDEMPQNPRICCFCSRIQDRSKMIKIPLSPARRSLWLAKLGIEIIERIEANVARLMCKNHFARDSFSKQGRLLKGTLPLLFAEKRVAVEFRIDGDAFVKVGGVGISILNKKESEEHRDEPDEPEEEEKPEIVVHC